MLGRPKPSRVSWLLGCLLNGAIATACATGPDGRETISDVNVVRWVEATVAERQPASAEKRFDEIAWVTDIRTAIRLGKEYNRPIFLYTGDGRINTGRC
jgi:hypothetical protein